MSTLTFPQLAAGGLGQYPIRKTRRSRTVVNPAADGGSLRLADFAGGTTEWQLDYAELADAEAETLTQFFTAAEGTLNQFTFLDPVGNLLEESGQLDAEVWQSDPLIALTGEVDDPRGGTAAWRATNGGGAAQSIGQTLQAPGDYQYCLSVDARSTAALNLGLQMGGHIAYRAISSAWKRVMLSGTGDTSADSVHFAIEIPAGATVEIYGIQVEPQPGASAYRMSNAGGVYTEARFMEDVLSVTRMGCNRNSCSVKIIHAKHL